MGAGPVACSGAGVPLMAAGGGAGVVTIWNLEERRLHTVLRDAHDAPLTALHFFAGEPRLMSAGADNALKQWVRGTALSENAPGLVLECQAPARPLQRGPCSQGTASEHLA
jgi:U3 small nucleolar RNA-associated protein 21